VSVLLTVAFGLDSYYTEFDYCHPKVTAAFHVCAALLLLSLCRKKL